MDFFELLGSVNKVSIFFFVVTLGVLTYELYVFRKEQKRKEKPKIPTFKGVQPQRMTATPVISDAQKPIKKRKNLAIALVAVMIAVFGTALYFTLQNTTTTEEVPPPVSTRATDTNISPAVTTGITPIITTSTSGATISISPSPTETILAQNQITLTPTTATTSAIGGGPTLTSTPSSNFVGSSISATLSLTKINSPTTTENLPVAGFSYPHLFILFLGAATVFFSILF